jgi:hypothetical protein
MNIPENAFPAALFIEVKQAPLDLMSIIHLELQRVRGSNSLYGGNCPICRGSKCFFIWLDKRRLFRCYECGIEGRLKK